MENQPSSQPNKQAAAKAAPMQRLVDQEQVMAFRHGGFWQPMDTLREKHELEQMWVSGTAPWKVWDEA